jgi:HSP20 family protein
MDVYRTRTGWLLKFDLAGVRREDVTVSVHGRVVRVSGHRRDWSLEEGLSYYSMEIIYSRFERAVEMPCEVGDGRLEMKLRDGILLLRIETGAAQGGREERK